MRLYNKGTLTLDKKPSTVAKLTAVNPDAINFCYSAFKFPQDSRKH